jgi:hypothetical protein
LTPTAPPTDATPYLQLCNLGKLKGLKENMDANGWITDEIHVLNFLISSRLPSCYLHYGIESYMEAATTDVGQVPAWETVVHTDIRPDQVFLQTPSHERLPVVKLGDFSPAMPPKAGVLVTKHRAGSLAGRNAWRPAEWFVVKISSPPHFETESLS